MNEPNKENPLNIVAVDIHEVNIPFRFRYGHAKAKHTGVKSIICIARDYEGREGYGEAVPRTYVTGETTASVQDALPALISHCDLGGSSFDSFQIKLANVETALFEDTSVPGCALCALDLAVSDLAARQQGSPVSQVLGSTPKNHLIYTASIGMSSRKKLIALLLLYKSMRFRHFKVKVGDENDIERLKLIRKHLGAEVTIFADANGAWDRETAVSQIDQFAAHRVWALEEPLKIPMAQNRESLLNDQHFADNAWVQSRSAIPLIADESLISLRTARNIVDSQAFKIFNIRLSKCGGYTRASQFAQIARDANLSFSLGAMVGESPILASAGATWGSCNPQHLYIQGHSHRVLHGMTFVEGCPPLRKGGVFAVPEKPNLHINKNALRELTVNQTTISISK